MVLCMTGYQGLYVSSLEKAMVRVFPSRLRENEKYIDLLGSTCNLRRLYVKLKLGSPHHQSMHGFFTAGTGQQFHSGAERCPGRWSATTAMVMGSAKSIRRLKSLPDGGEFLTRKDLKTYSAKDFFIDDENI